MDRASDYESAGWGFKSLWAHHLKSPYLLTFRPKHPCLTTKQYSHLVPDALRKAKVKIYMSIIFFDVETTGLSYNFHSVVSFACIIRDSNEEELTVQRFYYPDPEKEISYRAIEVNSLTNEKISSLRNGDSYPEYFKNDRYIEKIFENHADILVGHNINFDIRFINTAFGQNSKINKKLAEAKIFCTMENNKRNGKSLKLHEVCKLYKIEIAPESFHDSLWDTIAVKEIFDKMKKNKKED